MPVFLEVRPTLPANAIQEFLAHFKANPGKLSFGTPGDGSTPHLAAGMLKAQASVFAVHLPSRGAAPAMHDLLGGRWVSCSTRALANKALGTPAVKDRIAALRGVLAPMTLADVNTWAAIHSTRFGALIKARNIHAD